MPKQKHKHKHNKHMSAVVRILESHCSRAALEALHLAPWLARARFFRAKKKENKDPHPTQLAADIAALGPGFVMLLHMLASRGDMAPFHYRRAFSCATYQVRALSKKEVLAHIRAQLCAQPEKVFDHIDTCPYRTHLFGASYKAFLRGSQQGVLITIQHPRATMLLQRNLETIHAYLADTHARGIRNALWESLWDELHARAQLICNATHIGGRMEMLASQYATHAKIEVPAVVWNLTTQHMLVQEHEALPILADVADGKIKGLAKTYAARYVVEMALSMYGIGGTFLLRPQLADIQIGEKNRLIISNAVATGVLLPRDRRLFSALLFALAQKNYPAASRVLLDAHYAHPHHAKKMHPGVQWPESPRESLADTLWEFLEAGFRDQLHVPLGVSMAAESFYYVERLAHKLYPDVDMASACQDSIKKYMVRIFGIPKTSSLEKIVATIGLR